jgi:predicted nucleotidyltransferase component of viral defense system
MPAPLRNLPRSIHQRLIKKARELGEDPNHVFIRYVRERFLYRLGCSAYKEQFVLKGAMLFVAWTGQSLRPTRDLDLLGSGDSSDEALLRIIGEIIHTQVQPDGLEFDGQNAKISPIREAQDYPGKRIKLPVRLGTASYILQIDIGFGDAVTPEPARIDYPTLLDLPAPRMKAYPRETVVSEKLQILVVFGMSTSRMKDFYDLWTLSRYFSFDGALLVGAIGATFERRGTPIPQSVPTALTDRFAADRTKQIQWAAFLKRNGLADPAVGLSEVVQDLRAFVLEPMQTIAQKEVFPKSWKPGGPWA